MSELDVCSPPPKVAHGKRPRVSFAAPDQVLEIREFIESPEEKWLKVSTFQQVIHRKRLMRAALQARTGGASRMSALSSLFCCERMADAEPYYPQSRTHSDQSLPAQPSPLTLLTQMPQPLPHRAPEDDDGQPTNVHTQGQSLRAASKMPRLRRGRMLVSRCLSPRKAEEEDRDGAVESGSTLAFTTLRPAQYC